MGYPHNEKHLGAWLLTHFKVNRRAGTYGHPSVRQVNHGGSFKWVCIVRKDADAE